MKLSRSILLVELLIAVVQMSHYYPLMPETVASHFDAGGRPNGLESRAVFFGLTAFILVLTVAIFFLIGWLLRVLPAKWVNVPRREYWLAPERRQDTVEFMSHQLEWYGVATLLLLLLVIQDVFAANLTPEPRIDSRSMWIYLGGYFAYTAIWMVRFLRYFRVPQAQSL